MWGFLVVISGGFFYATGAIMNAKALPNPSVVKSKSEADAMFLLHKLAKQAKVEGKWTGNIDYDFFVANNDYRNTNWKSVIAGTSCILTVKVAGAEISDPRSMTAALGEHANTNRSVGYIDQTGSIVAWSQDHGSKPTPRNGVTDTPYIYECNLQ